MIGAEVEKIDLFGAVKVQILQQSRDGLLSMGKAVIDTAWESMPVHGRKESDADYETAPAGAPPYSHTETLREALAFAVEDGFLYVGTLFSKVGVRGAVLEYGGRARSKKRKTRRSGRAYKPHPFIGPALDKQRDTFAPRVAGSFTS